MIQQYIDTGVGARLKILRQKAESGFLQPLRNHGWTAEIEREVQRGEYLIIAAQRNEHKHKIALLYTSATDNSVYKALALEVEHIFTDGELYRIESYAFGINVPVTPSSDFFPLMLEWNASSAEGKFASQVALAGDDDDDGEETASHRLLLAEAPIEAIWLRIRQFHSVTLATKLIRERSKREGVELAEDVLRSKAEGVAFALRNATEYFTADRNQNVNQRILNLYYGSMAFAQAEMLSAPKGPHNLAQIEAGTKQGHGLYTIDGESDGLQNIVVGIISSGFFADWMRFLNVNIQAFPSKKPRKSEDVLALPVGSWITLEQLFARIPETGDLFRDIFPSPPQWLHPVFDQFANIAGGYSRSEAVLSKRSYIKLVDETGRLKIADIAAFPGPISQIQPLASSGKSNVYRAAIDHPDHKYWWGALPLHHSPFVRSALVMPVFEGVGQYRALCVVILYALSIIVRYRPSLWRRAQEGDLDHMRVLIEAFSAVAERVLPEQFLEQISGQRVSAKQPGSFF